MKVRGTVRSSLQSGDLVAARAALAPTLAGLGTHAATTAGDHPLAGQVGKIVIEAAREVVARDPPPSRDEAEDEVARIAREEFARRGLHDLDPEQALKAAKLVRAAVETAAREYGLIGELSDLRESRDRLESFEREKPELAAAMVAAAAHAQRAARIVVVPPHGTAANTEALCMAMAYAFAPFWRLPLTEADDSVASQLLQSVEATDSIFAKLCRALDSLLKHDCAEQLHLFALAWLESSFARLEVGHKLAAALALTDVPEELEVRAPWAAWSLSIPDGLFDTPELGRFRIRRAWCLGAEPVFGVTDSGDVHPLPAPGEDPVDVTGWTPEMIAVDARTRASLRSLVRGACLALSDPEEFRRDAGPRGASSGRKAKGRKGPPELEQARFILSKPLELDLRDELRRSLSGAARTGASPKVQFLVRGHWRQQAHGAGRLLRKTIWIEPFWKGPEESRVLLRRARVGEPEGEP